MRRKTIAIVGGGPAGAAAAERLCNGGRLRDTGRDGHHVLVFEERIGWEKPCGGGLTPKALRRYPFLAEAASGGNQVYDAEFLASTGTALRIHLRSPLAIYSRATLNQLLLRRAEDAGAEVVADRIVGLERQRGAWELTGRKQAYHADFVVLAAGARTRLRRTLAEDFLPRDLMLTFGYYLPGPLGPLRMQFYEKLEGYAWAFPRPDHVSVGICGKVGQKSMADLQALLTVFMQQFGYTPDRQANFSHLLPSLSAEGWGSLRLAGPGWALAGDAAGLVDPVTGEGIYYAMRSGEMLGQALLEGSPELYPERVRDEFGRALALGARLAKRFYCGEFLGGSVTTRMIEFGARSRRILGVLQDLIEGSQSYLGLMGLLYVEMARILLGTSLGRLRKVFELRVDDSHY